MIDFSDPQIIGIITAVGVLFGILAYFKKDKTTVNNASGNTNNGNGVQNNIAGNVSNSDLRVKNVKKKSKR